MVNSSLFRVLSTTDQGLKVNPISEKNDVFIDSNEESITVKTDNSNANLTQVLSFVNPGNIIYGDVTQSGDSYRFKSVEHRGGFSLVELDSEIIPFIIKQQKQKIKNEYISVDTDRIAIPLALLFDSETDDFCGDLVIQNPSVQQGTTWNEFRDGVGSEEIYGSFETVDGTPEEVFIGSPRGEDYWYAFLFPEYKTRVAQLIQAQFGYIYDDQFLPNQGWNSTELINEDKLPDEIQKNPKEILAEEFTVHSSALPERFGRNTTELLAELVYVGTQFELTFSDKSDDTLDPDEPFSYSPEEVRNASAPIITTYRFYTNLLIEIYDKFTTASETDLDSLIRRDTLPNPEVLYRAQQNFTSQIHELEAYFKKMRQVPVEAYVVEQFKKTIPNKKQELREEYGVEGLPLMIRHILYDLEQQLDEIKEVLELAAYVASAESTENGFQYEIRAEERAYQYIKRHQSKVTNLLTPADLGGEGSEIFMLTLGRLGRRHNWLDTSSLGATGSMLSQMDDKMR